MPGGPGGSGLSAVGGNSQEILYLTGGLYDVVSWDPRGVGSLTVCARPLAYPFNILMDC